MNAVSNETDTAPQTVSIRSRKRSSQPFSLAVRSVELDYCRFALTRAGDLSPWLWHRNSCMADPR